MTDKNVTFGVTLVTNKPEGKKRMWFKNSMFLYTKCHLPPEKSRASRTHDKHATQKSLGKVTTKNVTIGVTKVTPQSKKKKKNKKNLHGI